MNLILLYGLIEYKISMGYIISYKFEVDYGHMHGSRLKINNCQLVIVIHIYEQVM